MMWPLAVLSIAMLWWLPLAAVAYAPQRLQGAVYTQDRPYTETICNAAGQGGDPDIILCEDFEGIDDLRCIAFQNSGNFWYNPAFEDRRNTGACWFCNGGSRQFSTIAMDGLNQGTNHVWRIYPQTGGATDVVTGDTSGTGNGTLNGYLLDTIIGAGITEWYMRGEVYFSSNSIWPNDLDWKILWTTPDTGEEGSPCPDPPSCPWEAGYYHHEDTFCNPPNANFGDAPVIRYGANFGQFPYQNEYCPPLAVGADANGSQLVRFERDRWYTVEFHIINSASSGVGVLEMWIDGNLAYQDTRATCQNGCQTLKNVAVMGYWGTANATQTGYVEIDNVIVSRAPIGVRQTSSGDTLAPAAPPNLRIVEP